MCSDEVGIAHYLYEFAEPSALSYSNICYLCLGVSSGCFGG